MSNLKKSDRTKTEILDAAWDMIAAQGAAVSLAAIAKEVGITRQSIYVHFGSRAGLLLALVRRADVRYSIWKDFDAAYSAPVASDRLGAVLAAWLAFVPKIHPVATDLIRLRATDKDCAAAWKDRMDELYRFFLKVTTSFAKEGVLASGWDNESAADFLWSAVSVQAWDLLVSDRNRTPEQANVIIHRVVTKTLLA